MKNAILTGLILLFTYSSIAQEDKKALRKALNGLSTSEALDESELSPRVFLGQIARNPTNNNLELDLTGELVKLQGVLYRSAGGKVLTVDVAGKNENQTLAIFNGVKVNPKVTGTLLGTIPIKTWLGYKAASKDTILDKIIADSIQSLRSSKKEYYNKRRVEIEQECSKMVGFSERNVTMARTKKVEALVADSVSYFSYIENNLKYQLLLDNKREYNVMRRNFSFLSLGAQVEGAKYNLLKTDSIPDFVVERTNYTGWNLFAQLNMLNYNLVRERMTVHSFKAEYGETNNIEDLKEFSYLEQLVSSSGGQTVERKITGYIEPYFTQSRAKLSYEVNFYPMKSEIKQIGFLLGTDFTYFSKRSNQLGLHMGLNFPVTRKAKEGKSPFYISAIFSSIDPLNWAEKDAFMFKNTAVFSLRFAAPISFNFGSSK